MTSLRVVLLTPEYPPHVWGGLGTHVHALAEGLARAGHQPSVFAFSPKGTSSERVNGVMIHRVGLTEPIPPGLQGFEAERFAADAVTRAMVASAKQTFEVDGLPDVVHGHDWFSLGGLKALRDDLGLPLVGTVHMLGNPIHTWAGAPIPARDAEAEHDFCTLPDALITCSASMRDLVREYHHVASERLHVVYNAMDAAPFLAVPHRPNAAEKKIVFAGRLARMKGIAPLLASAARVLAVRSDVTYFIAGGQNVGLGGKLDASRILQLILDGNPKLNLHDDDTMALDDAAKQRLAERVKFVGWKSREELPAFYSDADIALVPSLYEPFGYAALEAMAAGVPVVATKAGGLAEIIEDGVSGLLVPTSGTGDGPRRVDIGALTAAQLRLLDEASLATRMSEAARARAQAFSAEQMVERTIDVYRAAAAKRAG